MLGDIPQKNLLDILQSAFMVLGFLLTAHTFISNNRTRRLEVLMEINNKYQDLKKTAIENPELSRVFLDASIDAIEITDAERYYARRIINHIFIVYSAIQGKQLKQFKGLEKDIRNLLSHSILNIVWKEMKLYQDSGFVQYVEEILRDTPTES